MFGSFWEIRSDRSAEHLANKTKRSVCITLPLKRRHNHHNRLFFLNIMDETFQFIIESPQHSQGHKKRPRLVTSCDNW